MIGSEALKKESPGKPTMSHNALQEWIGILDKGIGMKVRGKNSNNRGRHIRNQEQLE